MQLRLVRLLDTTDRSVAVWHAGAWIGLRPLIERRRTVGETVSPELVAASGDLLVFLGGGVALRDETTALLADVDGVVLPFDPAPLMPFAPRSFRDFMLYEAHAIGAARGLVRRFMPKLWPLLGAYEAITRRPAPPLRPKPLWYRRPIYYHGNHLSFLPDGATIPWPRYTRALDYEIELGVVIARPLADATPAEALAAIGGFVVLNDFSARDVQYPEMQSGFGPVKAKNFASGIGAVVVTPDEVLPKLDRLPFTVRVNGALWGRIRSARWSPTPRSVNAWCRANSSAPAPSPAAAEWRQANGSSQATRSS